MNRLAMLPMLALLLIVGQTVQGQEMPEPGLNEPAPEFELQDVQGNTHALVDYRGKIVVLHFQSPTCPWDKAYQPHLNEIAQQYQEQEEGQDTPEVVFIAINANQGETIDQLTQYAKERPVAYPILKDEGNKAADLYAARTTPHMYIIDPEGVLRYKGGVEQPPTAESEVGQMEPQFFAPALEAVVAGEQPEKADTPTKGCGIKRVKQQS